MADAAAYWSHAERYMQWAPHHPVIQNGSRDVYPLFLYGDDTRYTKNTGEKLTCICLGVLTDERRNSMLTHYPLCVIREVGYGLWSIALV